MIEFNRLHITGNEEKYMSEAIRRNKTLSGNGYFTEKCQKFFESRFGFYKCLLTTSCTDALELCAMLCELKPGDEVIIPSYTFVSTALAFIREGAKVVFADSMTTNPNIDVEKIESLITPRTKVIVPVHYAGVSCNMDAILELANKYHLIVVEDAAQGVYSSFKGKPLGGIGHLGAFSFHETKNITAGGEGGMVLINDEQFAKRAEILWEKGTNRAEFFRGEINKYGWVDIGSSFLPSELNAAFLWAQLENIDDIQYRRLGIWKQYDSRLRYLSQTGKLIAPEIPSYSSNNAHMYYFVLNSIDSRTKFINYMKSNGVAVAFHYQSLHNSSYYKNCHDGRVLSECDRYENCLVRLPFYYDLEESQIEEICELVSQFLGTI